MINGHISGEFRGFNYGSQVVLSLYGQGFYLYCSDRWVLVMVPSLIVGSIVSVFQAATQINEQNTLSFFCLG